MVKPIIITDPLITITSNEQGVAFQPSALIKSLFGEKLMSDVFYRRATATKQPAAAAAAKKQQQPQQNCKPKP